MLTFKIFVSISRRRPPQEIWNPWKLTIVTTNVSYFGAGIARKGKARGTEWSFFTRKHTTNPLLKIVVSCECRQTARLLVYLIDLVEIQVFNCQLLLCLVLSYMENCNTQKSPSRSYVTGISQIFGLNCSAINGRQLNPRKNIIFEHLKEIMTLLIGSGSYVV